MHKEEAIQATLKDIHLSEGNGFEADESSILEEYKKQAANQSSLAIKILSIAGGFIASLAFLGFLLIAGLYESEIALMISGVAFILAAIGLNKVYNQLVIDTLSVSIYAIGFCLLGFGLLGMKVDENLTIFIILMSALASLFIIQNYILSFISVLIISGSLLTLIISNDQYNLIPLYTLCITLVLTYVMLNEAKIITSGKRLNKLYNPLRIGLIISLLFGLGPIGKRGMLPISTDFIWISSIPVFFIAIYLISIILAILEIKGLQKKAIIYSLSILVLLSTTFSPAILGAILILLLSFLVNYKTGLAIGIIALIYFISQYYYDLNFTLLTKSMMLGASGILFIALYLFTNKKELHETI